MSRFVKIERLVVQFGSGVEPFIWLNKDNVVSVFVKNDLTHIGTIDGHTEKTKMSIDEVMELLNK